MKYLDAVEQSVQTLNNRVIQQTNMATIEIDEEVYEALQIPEGERSQAMKQELAVSLYARDILSFGKARASRAVQARVPRATRRARNSTSLHRNRTRRGPRICRITSL